MPDQPNPIAPRPSAPPGPPALPPVEPGTAGEEDSYDLAPPPLPRGGAPALPPLASLPPTVRVADPLPMPALPAGPVEYARPGTVRARSGRPGVVTALGVSAIVLGAIGILSNFLFLAQGRRLWRLTDPPPPQAAPPPPLAPPADLRPYAGEFTGERGVTRPARLAAVEAIDRRVRLNADRRVMLDRLLSEVGADVLVVPPGDTPLTPDQAAAAIVEVTERPGGPDDPTLLGSHVVRTRSGTLVVNNREATFSAADQPGRGSVFLAWYTARDGRRQWCAGAIEEAMARAQAQLTTGGGSGMNALQAAALARQVRAVDPPRPEEHEGPEPPTPIRQIEPLGTSATIGAVVAQSRYRQVVWLLPNGATAQPPELHHPGWDFTTGQPHFRPPATANYLPVSKPAVGYMYADLYFGVILGLAAIACGVLTLIDLPWARLLLLAYAAVKLAAAVTLLVASFWFVIELAHLQRKGTAGLPADLGAQAPTAMAGLAIVALLAQAAFPVVLLIVLNTRTVRAHFRERGERPLVSPRTARGPGARRALLLTSMTAAALAVGHLALGIGGVMGSGFVAAAAHLIGAAVVGAVGVLAWRWSQAPAPPPGGSVTLALLALLVCSAGASPRQPRVPDRKPGGPAATAPPAAQNPALAELVNTVRTSPDERQVRQAIDALLRQRPGGVAALFRLMYDPDRAVRAKVLSGLGDWPHDRAWLREHEPAALQEFAKAVPALTEAVLGGDGDGGEAAAKLFERLGMGGVPTRPFGEFLSGRGGGLPARDRARRLLALAPYSPQAAETMTHLWATQDPGQAKVAETWFATTARDATKVLLYLHDPNPAVRASVVRTGRWKELMAPDVPGSDQVLPALVKRAATDPSPDVRRAILHTLTTMDDVGEEALVEVLAADGLDEATRRELAQTIARGPGLQGLRSPAAIARVRKLLDDPRPAARAAALHVYSDPYFRGEVPYGRVIDLLFDPDLKTARLAAHLLNRRPYAVARALGPASQHRLTRLGEKSEAEAARRLAADEALRANPPTWPPPPPAPAGTASPSGGSGAGWRGTAALALWAMTTVALLWVVLFGIARASPAPPPPWPQAVPVPPYLPPPGGPFPPRP